VTEPIDEFLPLFALRAMRLYGLLIRPASGTIRREMLRLLARRCSDSISPR
jgi:hypothetical protein